MPLLAQHIARTPFSTLVERGLLKGTFEDMLQLVYCKHPSIRYRWSRTHIDSDPQITFFHLIHKRLDIRPVLKRFYPVFLVLSIGQTKSYAISLGLALFTAVHLINTILDLIRLLLTLTSSRYRAYTATRTRSTLPMTGKRRRGSEGDVVGISRLRREEIDCTSKREQSKRKRVDDLDIPPLFDSSSKKSRLWSFHPADIQSSRVARKMAPRVPRYLYPWTPERPPWYTLRVHKRYKKPKRRLVRHSRGQVQGMEDFLSRYDPPFNVFCLDDLRDSLPVLDRADFSARGRSATVDRLRSAEEKDDEKDEEEDEL
ncbi:MAG: hypothetical protein HETSPECPRED_002043 [Heterodermia speciosa]|uniref:Uncharacterized protein n=1 Tax=Heterodermia speciosa TaxID=116794 RepID=A0A8H3I4G5_9LECA|nr:MAG: hypothetical protein HETSPECPRED_002043 [Heterodermia speciosa]